MARITDLLDEKSLFFFAASSPGKCWFPAWLTGKSSQTWHTLDNKRSYTFHSSNKSLLVSRLNGGPRDAESPDFLTLPVQEEDRHDTKVLCNNVKVHDVEQNVFMIVAHYTAGW